MSQTPELSNISLVDTQRNRVEVSKGCLTTFPTQGGVYKVQVAETVPTCWTLEEDLLYFLFTGCRGEPAPPNVEGILNGMAVISETIYGGSYSYMLTGRIKSRQPIYCYAIAGENPT